MTNALIKTDVVKRYRRVIRRYQKLIKYDGSYADWHDLYVDTGRVTIDLEDWKRDLEESMTRRRRAKKSTDAHRTVMNTVEVRQLKMRQVARYANHKLLKLEIGIYN